MSNYLFFFFIIIVLIYDYYYFLINTIIIVEKVHMRRMLKLLSFSDEYIAQLRSVSHNMRGSASHSKSLLSKSVLSPNNNNKQPLTPTTATTTTATSSATAVGGRGVNNTSNTNNVSTKINNNTIRSTPSSNGNKANTNTNTTNSNIPVTPNATSTSTSPSLISPRAIDSNNSSESVESPSTRIRRSSLVSSKFSDYKRPNLQQSSSIKSSSNIAASRLSIAIISGSSIPEEAEFSTGTFGLPYIYDPFNDHPIDVALLPLTSLQTDFEKLEKENSPNTTSTAITSATTATTITTTNPTSNSLLSRYGQLIIKHEKSFINIIMLEILACCIFGIKPMVLTKEKEYITHLTNAVLNPSNPDGILLSPHHPHGLPGTEWAIINKQWYDNWIAYTSSPISTSGNNTNTNNTLVSNFTNPINSIANTANNVKTKAVAALSTVSGRTNNNSQPIVFPGTIDNIAICLKSNQLVVTTHNLRNNKILMPNCSLNSNIEALPLPVYNALYNWYGGGPTIIRTVITLENNENNNPSFGVSVTASYSDSRRPFSPVTNTATNNGTTKPLKRMSDVLSVTTELELYPLCLKILFCSIHGKIITDASMDMVYSRSTTIQVILMELCRHSKVDSTRGRLWNLNNYNPTGNTQTIDSNNNNAANKPIPKTNSLDVNDSSFYVLALDDTVGQLKLIEGQYLLFELCQEDGRWPRTNSSTQFQTSVGISNKLSYNGNYDNIHPVTSLIDLKQSDGRIGLENLGNTCYMNSSLQALLHIDLLTEYFLRNSYIRDINHDSKFGFKGKMAQCYSRLVKELWTTGVDKNVINPQSFHTELTSMLNQFGGNDQHDAQELLACLLDGLSEDLNLIHNKPYIPNPDSDGQNEYELADMWWANHFKRENSVIQCIFTGQLKSVLTCGCGKYSSARYEPFSFLTLPVPEDSERVITVFVMLRNTVSALECLIRVHKDADIRNLIDKIYDLNITGIEPKPTTTSSTSSPTNATSTTTAPTTTNTITSSIIWDSQFLIGEVSNSMVLGLVDANRKIASIKESENIFLFQIPILSTKDINEANSNTVATKTAVATTGRPRQSAQLKQNTLLKTYIKNTCYVSYVI